jgi:hypothetical protein
VIENQQALGVRRLALIFDQQISRGDPRKPRKSGRPVSSGGKLIPPSLPRPTRSLLR